jgi:hypothetical protein
MAISKYSGVSWSSISKINGISKASISKLAGIDSTSSGGGGGGGSGPSCTTVYFGYADARSNPPARACDAPPQSYEFDATNNLLYTPGGCGSSFADPGFYSDGRTVYYWDGETSWTRIGKCPDN